MTQRQKQQEKMLLDLLDEAYLNSYSKVSIHDLIALGEPVNFNNYYCPRELQLELLEKHSKGKHKLTKDFLSFNFNLGASPSSVDFYYLITGDNFELNTFRIKWEENGVYYDNPKTGRTLCSMDRLGNNIKTVFTDIIYEDNFLPSVHNFTFKARGQQFTVKRKIIKNEDNRN